MNMKRTYRILSITLVAIALCCSACARMPKPKRSASLIQHHFNWYGKKYPDTVYGKTKVKSVEITGQQEIHKNLVAVEAFITLSDDAIQRIHATIEKGPLYWRFVSWENATGM